jgi:uncharacterized protein
LLPCFMESTFTWDEGKNNKNRVKHQVSFEEAQYAFADDNRLILEDIAHSTTEKRFFCIAKVPSGIITVRFTYRQNKIRIFGAAFWRKGKKMYVTKLKKEKYDQ